MNKSMLSRALGGGVLGALLVPLMMILLNSMTGFFPADGVAPPTYLLIPYTMWIAFDHHLLPALAVEAALSFAFGASVGVATLPFADDSQDLLRRSVLHLLVSGLLFFALCFACQAGSTGGLQASFLLLGLYAVLYVLIWFSRWLHWYADVLSIREKLGLAAARSPLNWRKTAVYLPFLIVLCVLVPFCAYLFDRFVVVDVPVCSAILVPFLVLPVAGFCSGLSLGRWAGFCPLYPLLGFVLYLPAVFLLMNSSAAFHGVILLLFALAGNVLGSALLYYRKRKTTA